MLILSILHFAIMSGFHRFGHKYIYHTHTQHTVNSKTFLSIHSNVYLHFETLTVRTAIWWFGLITNQGIDWTISLNFHYLSYCPVHRPILKSSHPHEFSNRDPHALLCVYYVTRIKLTKVCSSLIIAYT